MKEISTIEVEALVKTNAPIRMIDVREEDEVATGIIPHAIHIPLGLIESTMKDLDPSQQYIMICRSGNRSSMAAKLLEEHGYNVMNMTGGMLEYSGPKE